MHDRQKHWEEIYRRATPENLSWYQNEPVLSLELIAAVCLSRDDAVIDVIGFCLLPGLIRKYFLLDIVIFNA